MHDRPNGICFPAKRRHDMSAPKRAIRRDEISGQERHSGKTVPKNHSSDSNLVKYANNRLFAYLYLHQRALRSMVNMVCYPTNLFSNQGKSTLIGKVVWPSIWARHHRRKSEHMTQYHQTTLCGEQVSHTCVSIIPQNEPKERKNFT